MSALLYEIYFRKYGVRRVAQLMTPPLPELKDLQLPRGAVFHYPGSSNLDQGPASDEFLFRNVTRPIWVQHVLQNGDSKGNPIRLAQPLEPLIRKYHMANRRFKWSRAVEQGLREPMAPFVMNYAWLHRAYKYVRSLYTDYNRWWNINAAVWENVAELAKKTDRQQFIEIKLPKILPSPSVLRLAAEMYQDGAIAERASVRLAGALESFAMESGAPLLPGTGGLALEAMTQRMMKFFNSAESLTLLELWKWAGERREESLIGKVARKDLARVNLIFMESGRWFVLNLGVLDSWRAPSKKELELEPERSTKGIEPHQMQRRILRLAMSLFQVRTNANPEVDAEVDAAGKPAETKEVAPTVIKQTTALPTVDPTTGAVKIGTAETPVETDNLVDDNAPTEKAEDIEVDKHLDEQIDKDLEELDRLAHAQAAIQSELEVQALEVVEKPELEDGVIKVCNRLADEGMLSAAEYRRYQELAESHKKIIAPDGKSTLTEFVALKPEDVKIEASGMIPEIKTVVDKTMLKSSLLDFDERYIKKVLARDVASMVMQVQNAGICVTNFQVETVEDIVGSHQQYTIRLNPVEGANSTLRFHIPTLEADGTFQSNGIKYRMRKQRGDLPIRKISPSKVALTSYYGKVFVSRSEKRVNDYGTWLRNTIMAFGLDTGAPDNPVTDLQTANVFDPLFEAPKLYSTLAMAFRGFRLGGFSWVLDHTRREQSFNLVAQETYEKDGAILVGGNEKGEYLVMDKDSALYVGKDGVLTEANSITNMLGVSPIKAPVEFAELKVLGRTVPLALVLGYELGLEKLMKLLRVEPRRVPAGTRLNLDDNEYPIVFADETLVFNRDDALASMVLAGFNEYHRAIREYGVYDFNKRGVYLNVLESAGASTKYLREIDLMYQMFIDPITRELLVEMKEPTDFRGLLLRCCQLLLNDQHPDELDPAWMRIKGYERFAGHVYAELVKSIRVHNSRTAKGKHPIDMSPFAVAQAIALDPAKMQVVDINPIQNLKEQEAVTYSGTGGRGSRSMTKHTRAYHVNDMGTMSESTVDSSDVGINLYTSADPQFTSLRGVSKRYEIGKTGATALLSTSALISPASDRDDPKRVNFVGIQHAHGVACSGYHQMPLRTGYEQVVAHRTGDLFAFSARKDGRVVSITDDGMVVEYDDGERKGIELGRRYGSAAGLTIPHGVATDLKEGQKFKAGTILSYNTGFFERDMLNPKNVVWKAGVLVKTVLLESSQTLEDSSSISKRVAQLLTTQVTKVRQIVVTFDQSVRRLVKAGDQLESEDILCVIEDAVTANSNLFDEETLDTLKVLGAPTPQAKSRGTVERIEVYYHGDKEDMSDSLRAIANASDRDLIKRARAAGKKGFTGSVDESFRVDGEPLALDTLCIRVYITSDVAAGVGDKGVFCNQMKTVFGEVMPNELKTESGQVVDCVFGRKSIADRIVISPDVIGTSNTLLGVFSKMVAAAYRGR